MYKLLISTTILIIKFEYNMVPTNSIYSSFPFAFRDLPILIMHKVYFNIVKYSHRITAIITIYIVNNIFLIF